jgi:hypothetical protein
MPQGIETLIVYLNAPSYDYSGNSDFVAHSHEFSSKHHYKECVLPLESQLHHQLPI